MTVRTEHSRRLVAEGGQLNTRLRGRQHPHAVETLDPESPRRPEIQQEIRQGIRTQKGKVRGRSSGGFPIY